MPQKIHCKVKKIEDHGEHVYTVELKPERPVPRFKPGQFLHLALDDYDPSGFWPESRVFSIASSPAKRDFVSISYSVRGVFTARMERELHEGQHIWIKLPYGEFIIDSSTDVVLIAGGTGITAFTAFLANLTPDNPNMIYLVYGARNTDLLLYKGMIDSQAYLTSRLKVFYFIETQQTQQTPQTQQTQQTQQTVFFEGCISLEAIWSQLENPHVAAYYIAGPPAMIQAINAEIVVRKISPEKIKVDAWE